MAERKTFKRGKAVLSTHNPKMAKTLEKMGYKESKDAKDADEGKKTDISRQELMDEAKSLGLNPHHNTSAEKLQAMIDEAKQIGPQE